jgi:Fe-Mn family superoxide dismutase
MQKYEIKDFSHLVKDENGNDIKIGEISTKAFAIHLKLYEGYVNNTNIILEKLNFLNNQRSENPDYYNKFVPEFNELNRRFGWEWNGMRNHELFFDSLCATRTEFPSLLKGGDTTVGSAEDLTTWKKDFEAMCKIRGIGWAMLVQDKRTKQLMSVWVNEHDAGMLSDVNIILNFDMFEHAYISDFGTDRQKYLDGLWAHVNWEVVQNRLV